MIRSQTTVLDEPGLGPLGLLLGRIWMLEVIVIVSWVGKNHWLVIVEVDGRRRCRGLVAACSRKRCVPNAVSCTKTESVVTVNRSNTVSVASVIFFFRTQSFKIL